MNRLFIVFVLTFSVSKVFGADDLRNWSAEFYLAGSDFVSHYPTCLTRKASYKKEPVMTKGLNDWICLIPNACKK